MSGLKVLLLPCYFPGLESGRNASHLLTFVDAAFNIWCLELSAMRSQLILGINRKAM
jgi:hypothetical protein